jgi:regulator of cell morphogenesis and NO signaling
LLLHLKLEDEKVFPYIINLYENKTLSAEGSFIEVIENEHTNVEVKLSDLENLIIRHLSPNYEDNAMNEFLTALLQFENDLNDHARIEDHILITKVIEFEKKLRK